MRAQKIGHRLTRKSLEISAIKRVPRGGPLEGDSQNVSVTWLLRRGSEVRRENVLLRGEMKDHSEKTERQRLLGRTAAIEGD